MPLRRSLPERPRAPDRLSLPEPGMAEPPLPGFGISIVLANETGGKELRFLPVICNSQFTII
jgi:hypothetical protein